LERFGAAIDACVAASHAASPYSEWLKRPNYEMFQAVAETQNMRNIVESSTSGVQISGIQNVTTVFSGQGYCVHNYNDPLKWTEFNPEVKALC